MNLPFRGSNKINPFETALKSIILIFFGNLHPQIFTAQKQ
jgi:hypothetical protein